MANSSANQVKLRGAVIGYGFISGKGHIPAYLARAKNADTSKAAVDIVAVADICEERRAAALKNIPGVRVYADYETLLVKEAANLDFVDISTPPCDHAKIAHAAFNAGLHVLCEKPLTPTLEEAHSLLKHATEAKRVIFPCHNYKHAPVVKTIHDIIASGKIGKVRSLNLSTYRNTHAKGVTEWKTNWRREKKYSGGGIAMDHGSHTFYLTFDWLGEYPTAVTAKMTNQSLSAPAGATTAKYDTEDNFSCVLTFPSGIANANLTWTAGVRKVIYTVQGEKGAITVDDDDLQLATMVKTDGPDVAQGAVKWEVEKRVIESDWMDASHVTWFNSMFDQFAECIAKNEYVGKEAKESYLCIQLITNAYASAEDGCRERPLATDVKI